MKGSTELCSLLEVLEYNLSSHLLLAPRAAGVLWLVASFHLQGHLNHVSLTDDTAPSSTVKDMIILELPNLR